MERLLRRYKEAMSSASRQEVYGALGTSRQALSQYNDRRSEWLDYVDSAESMLLRLRVGHGGLGLEKAYYMIRPEGMGRDAFIRQMQLRGHGLQRRRNFVRTTRSGIFRYPNLIKNMIIKGLNRVWQSDTTYYRLRERFYYLTFIIDLYSRFIVGYYVSKDLRAWANIQAIKMALRRRGGMLLSELIFHSDGGSQYRQEQFVALLRRKSISSSMCDTALDNAYAEKVNDVIKNEYLEHWSIDSFSSLRRAVKRAVDNYNKVRIHGQLPLRLSPMQFESYLSSTAGHQAVPLFIKDGQAKSLEYMPMAAQNLSYPVSAACEGITQILPAFVKLGLPKKNRQLTLHLE